MIIYHSGPDHRSGNGHQLKTEVNIDEDVIYLSRVINSKLFVIEIRSDSFKVVSRVTKMLNSDFAKLGQAFKNLKGEVLL